MQAFSIITTTRAKQRAVFDIIEQHVFNPEYEIDPKNIFRKSDFDKIWATLNERYIINEKNDGKRFLMIETARLFVQAHPDLIDKHFLLYMLQRMNSDRMEATGALKVFRVIADHVRSGKIHDVSNLVNTKTLEAAFKVLIYSPNPPNEPGFDNRMIEEVIRFFDYLVQKNSSTPKNFLTRLLLIKSREIRGTG